jgi:hypothetical protein
MMGQIDLTIVCRVPQFHFLHFDFPRYFDKVPCPRILEYSETGSPRGMSSSGLHKTD